jgi:hypothetical protein
VTIPAGDELVSEQRRLAATSSLVNVVPAHVDDMVQLRAEELPDWFHQLGLPAGWQVACVEDARVQAARIAVCGQRSHGGWDGCETISVFGLNGIPPVEIVRDNVDCTLRDLDANDITTCNLAASLTAGVTSVLSSGTFSLGGRRIWAQHANYLYAAASATSSNGGVLVEHDIYVDADCHDRFVHDIERLTCVVYEALLRSIGAARGTPTG